MAITGGSLTGFQAHQARNETHRDEESRRLRQKRSR